MEPTPTATVTDDTAVELEHGADADEVEDELLVEEISIDGMCGVY
jgi:mycofactocin precursor